LIAGLSSTPSLKAGLIRGMRQGFKSFITLTKVMAPVYILISILKELNVLTWLADLFAPFMKFFGLSGESALVLVSGWTVNLYGAIAVLAGTEFSVRQVTIMAVMLGISHSLVMETAIVSRMKARPFFIMTERIGLSLIVGYILNLILPAAL